MVMTCTFKDKDEGVVMKRHERDKRQNEVGRGSRAVHHHPNNNNHHSKIHIPKATKAIFLLTVCTLFCAQLPTTSASPGRAGAGRGGHSFQPLPAFLPLLLAFPPRGDFFTLSPRLTAVATTATLFAAALWGDLGRVALAHKAADNLYESIMGSDMTSEEKFKSVLLMQHRRYCETSRTCLGLELGRCGYCKPCQCDDRCHHYGDCCPDKLLENVKKIQPLEIAWDCRDNLYSGYTAEQRKSRLANATSYLMTSSCPPQAPADVKSACEDRSTYVPVSARGKGGKGPRHDSRVFQNLHCARCHGLDESTVIHWKTMLHCGSTRNFTSTTALDKAKEAANHEDCYIMLHPPPSLPAPRVCYFDSSIITACNVTGQWPSRDQFTQRACSAYLDPKVVDGQVYQNVFCYICNTADPQLFERCDRTSGLNPMPFSALLDFSDAIYGETGPEIEHKCSESEVYDDTTDRCRPVLCSPRRHFMDGLCSPLFSTARGLAYSLYFAVHFDEDLDLYDGDDLLHVLPGILEYMLTWQTVLKDTVRVTDFEVSFETTDEDGRCSQKSRQLSVFCTFKVMGDVKQDHLETELMALRHTNMTLPVHSRLTLTFSTQVDEGVWQDVKFRSSATLGRACSTRVSNHHEVMEGDAEIVYTRVHNLMTLPRLALARDEYHVRTDDLGLEVPWLDEAIPLERYQTAADGVVYIALSDFMPKIAAYRSSLYTPDTAEVILSQVCTALSLACLAFTFITYAIFAPLRTGPGKNNMNLCATLFLAQLFYLVGSGRTEVIGLCRALGILIHYFWLAAFAAMLVCSYFMWRVFTSFKAAADDVDRRRRFLQYTVFVWGSAAMVVVLTLLAHIIVSGGDDIGYGGHQCYLSTGVGVGVAMGVPVFVCITCSLVLFTLTVRAIRQSPKLTCKSREDERHVWVYLKLSTLTGATWILAFVVFFTQVTALRYLFTIVNALQGVFIFLSFVCNRRVVKMYRACLQGGHSRFSSATSASAKSTTSSSFRKTSLSTISHKTETSFADTVPSSRVVRD